MNAAPLVSLVVPMHNRQQLIERCLDSLLAQEYRPLEVLLVDNASTDATRLRAAQWMEAHHSQAVAKDCTFALLDEARQGADYARHTGLLRARGEYVAFFDDDDEFSPHFIGQMLAALRAKPEARWVHCRTLMVMPDGREQVRAGWPQPTLADHLLGALISTQSFVAEREWLSNLRAWTPHLPLWDDYYLGALLLLHAPSPAWCKGVFHRIVQHAQSLTGAQLSPKWEQAAATLEVLQALLHQATQHTLLSHKALRSAQRALFLRAHLTAGLLRREGSANAAQALLARWTAAAPTTYQPSALLRLMGCILESYTAWGGRGAWRMALLLCR